MAIAHLLPARSKIAAVEHHASLPYAEMPAFIAKLRGRDALAARALEFSILTATRTSETLEAEWPEIDLAGRVWTIPGTRMKNGKPYRVLLTDATLAVLANLPRPEGSDYVFPGERKNRPLSNMAFLMLLRRMGHCELTAHGFRTTFRTWAAECTSFPREVAEMALSHAVGTAVERAYQRGDLFVKRRELMEAWTDYINASLPTAKQGIVMKRGRPAFEPRVGLYLWVLIEAYREPIQAGRPRASIRQASERLRGVDPYSMARIRLRTTG